jgi:preprotein translocase subunit SecF
MIDFLKYRPICALFSVLIFATFIGMYTYRKVTRGHAFSYSVEFTGGTQVLLHFDKPVKSSQVIDILQNHGWHGATTREFSANELLVRIKETSSDIAHVASTIKNSLEAGLPGTTIQVLKVDSIGEGLGATLSSNSLQAVVLGLILMLIYIAWRFWSFSYATGAVVSLAHDAIVILLLFLIFDKEISMNVIGAIMAVLGYSINDTIVIFARIRDNIKTMKNSSINDIVNLSINQTLRRTILTTFATMLVVLALLLLGGETLRDLALALFVGIVFGIYSTIYIANPVMLFLYKEQH